MNTFKKTRELHFEREVTNAIQNIIMTENINQEIIRHSNSKCTTCRQTAIRFAQKRLDVVNERLSKTNPRILRIAKRKMYQILNAKINT